MKIQSFMPSNSKIRLRLQDNYDRRLPTKKLSRNQKSILLLNNDFSKQNREKYTTPLPSQKKFNTVTDFVKNRKNSFTKSNSSLPKNIQTEGKQKLEDLLQTRQIKNFRKPLESTDSLRHAEKILQSLLVRRIAAQAQGQEVAMKRSDLAIMLALMLDTRTRVGESQTFSFLVDLLNDIRSEHGRSTRDLLTSERKPRRLRLESATVSLKCNASSTCKPPVASNLVLQYTQTQKERESPSSVNSHHLQIKRLRDSLVSQQSLLTNIKNGPSNKRSCRISEGTLDYFHSLSLEKQLQSKDQLNAALDYVLQQNELLMKVASQQFKKYESEIYEYGLILQTKHLEIDLEYQQFTAHDDYEGTATNFKGMLAQAMPAASRGEFWDYKLIIDSFQALHSKCQARDAQLKKLIEVKSTFISQFSSRMELWIENLALKRQFNDNLARYIQKQGQFTQASIASIATSLQGRTSSHLSSNMHELSTSLQLFFENLLKSHQFS